MKRTKSIIPGTRAFKRVFGDDLENACYPVRQRNIQDNEIAIFFPGGFDALAVYAKTEEQKELQLTTAENLYRHLETSRTLEFISVSRKVA